MSILIDKESPKYLGEWTVGDKWPFPYFIFREKVFNVSSLKFVEQAINPVNYTAIKFCTRLITNKQDPDDHTKDNTYQNLTSDGNGVYHYEWDDDDLSKAGVYYCRAEFTRTDGKKSHSSYYFFEVCQKMMSSNSIG